MSKFIQNSNWVLVLLDGLEDQRPLFTLEKNFRTPVKTHLSNLLEKRQYLKQRNTIKWVNLGNENIDYFQAMATNNHRKNFITSLIVTGDVVTDHDQMANVL